MLSHRPLRLALIVVTMATLDACAARHPAPAPVVKPPPVAAPPVAPAVKPPPPKPPAPATATDQRPADISLTGLSRPEVTAILGDPQDQLDSNPGQTWIYRNGQCTVEILFLLDVMRNDSFVVDPRITGTDGTPRGNQLCLRRIANHHGK